MGWERANKIGRLREQNMIARHNKELREQKENYQKRITLLTVQHINDLKEGRANHKVDRAELIVSHRKEIKEYDKLFNERCSRNDTLRAEAVERADSIKYRAQKSEDYWNKQLIKINDFIAQATGTVGVISGRYKDAQLRLAEMSTGEDMLKNLGKTLDTISKNAHSHSPKMVDGK